MRGFLSEQFAPTFTGEVMMRLAAPQRFGERELTVAGFKVRAWWVSGVLPLRAHEENGRTSTGITVVVRPDWLERPPVVTPLASFIRREGDWHAYPDGSLCYVLAAEWRDRLGKFMTNSSEDISRAIDYGATWLLSATDSLVTRHLLGARHSLEKWPSEWVAYAHGEEGEKEYRRLKHAGGQQLQTKS